MNSITSYKKLIKFSKQTKDINPNLYNDIKRRIIKPSKVLFVQKIKDPKHSETRVKVAS